MIKPFNQFILESSYYQQLGFLAIDDILFDEWLDITDNALAFTKEEMDRLNKSFIKVLNDNNVSVDFKITKKDRDRLINKYVRGNENDIYRRKVYNGDDIVQYNININNDDIIICIYKAEDEWYYLSFLGWNGDYKCDQLEGVYKLFDDLIKDVYT